MKREWKVALPVAFIALWVATCRSTPVTPAALEIVSFTATAPNIELGQSSTLSWTVTGARSLVIDNGVGDVTGLASVTVTPTATTTYTLTATGNAGSTTAGAAVMIMGPVIASFTATPSSFAPGASSTLSWSVTGASSLSIDNGIGDVTGETSVTVVPTATTTYTLTAIGDGGTRSSTVLVTVLPAPLIISFTAAPSSIVSGGSSTLCWEVVDAVTLSIDQDVGDVSGLPCAVVYPLAATTYRLTATGDGGSTSATVKVTIIPAPSIDSFTATPSLIASGTSSTLSWSATGASSLSIAPGVGDVTGSPSVMVSPSATTTYTLTAIGDGGTTNATAQVTVNDAPNGTIVLPAGDVSVPAGGAVDFTGACADPNDDDVTYFWSFDTGASDTTVQNPGSVIFTTPGIYVVTYTCTDSRGLADPTPDTRTITVLRTLSGTLTFDKVPASVTGLHYAGTVQRPLRGIDVALVDADDLASVLATTVSDSLGHYMLTWLPDGPTSVKVIFYARTASPKISVEDNTSGDAQYAGLSPTINATGMSMMSLNAPSGWTGTSYASRAAAPFAVLDAATEAVLGFLATRPAAVFPDLHIKWSANNAPVQPDQAPPYADGNIGTSHWDGDALYLLGKQDVDTDEFDDHVIVHEWGHYFESKLSRSDSPGGNHSAGDLKDARLAFGEGWGNALSGMIWSSANTVYADSSGPGQANGWGFDLENNVTIDPSPGWFSAGSVQSILFDLFDDSGSNEAFDPVALGLGPIYDVMTGEQKSTTALTTLFSFITALKAANPGQAEAIDTLTAYRTVVGVPVADAYGTGETVDGGDPVNLPIYRALAVGAGVDVTFYGAVTNELGQNRYLRFNGDGASHTVSLATAPTFHDVGVIVYRVGVPQASALGPNGTATASFTTQSGAEYVIVVTRQASSGTTSTTVTLN